MEQCIILAARRYDFTDSSGKRVEGVTITYLTPDLQEDGNTRGCQPLSVSAPAELWSEVVRLPAYCDMEFKQRPGPKGKPTLQLVGIIPLRPLDLFPKAGA